KFCTCAQGDYKDWDGDGVPNCPHWSRTVYMEATSSQAGTLLLCQRTQLPGTTPDTVDSAVPGDPTKYRYCALDIYSKNANPGRDDPPCLIQIGIGQVPIRTCLADAINKKTRFNLTWNDLPDGDYKLNFVNVDTAGNPSKTDYPVTFHVGNP